MKHVLFFMLILGFTFSSKAQIDTPAPSPASKLEQKVGLTDVTITYSRPSMRGRTVFGNLVPYNKLWRTGANQNTIINFSNDVTIAGQALKAGSYALFTKPNSTSWDVYFYNTTNNWGLPQAWDDRNVAAQVTVVPTAFPFRVETFTMSIDELKSTGAVISILWENTYVAIPFEVPTDKTVTAAIERAMSGPSAGDYYAAAVYYLQEGKDINQAKTWMDKAMSMFKKPTYWQLRQQSLIYAKSGDKSGAIELARKSLESAKAAGNDDYVKMNVDSLKEWGIKQ